MARPDVAIVAPYPPGGARHAGSSGVASYTANLSRALTEAGAAVTVVAPTLGGEPDTTTDDGVRVERRFRRGPLAVPTAMHAARATGAPVVHVQHELFLYGGRSAVPGLLALRGRDTATVVTMHQVVDPDDVDREYTRMHRVDAPATVARTGIDAVQRLIAGVADRVIVHEPSFALTVRGAAVVPHGVERAEPQDSAAARAALGEPPDGLLVLCFGFLAPYKGLETVCDAALRAGPAVRLVVAGGEHPRLAEAADPYARLLRERFGHRVRFTGYVPEQDVGLWFSAADVAVFAYPRPHASSGALALAYAYRTPVLLSRALSERVGAPAELTVEDGSEPLAARLLELADDPCRLLGAREVVDRFGHGRSWASVARAHLEVYAEAAGRRGGRA